MGKMQIITLVFWILIAASCAGFGFFVARYIKTYQVFEYIWAKITGRVQKADRIRREQMKTAYERHSGLSEEEKRKPKFILKIYHIVSMSGITEKIPGMSELTFIIIVIGLAIVIFGIAFRFKGVLVALVLTAAFIGVLIYLLLIMAYRRKVSVESQLLDFVNQVVLTSRQYSSLIDIFGMIYEEFKGTLSKTLEACYVEARSTNNNDKALLHLKDKIDSRQFSFVIDNLSLCSKESGDYYGVATDLTSVIKIYIESFEEKQAILRNAKITLSIMAILSGIILYSLSVFVGGRNAVFDGNMEIIITAALVVLYIYSMNMRAE